MKTKKLLTTVVVLMVALIAGCVKDDFAEIVGVCPAVESTSPANKAMGVSLSKVIAVTFNEKMNPATINASSFTIQGLSPVAGAITYNDRTASFTPTTPLTANITYTGKITTLVKDMMGNAIQEDYIWTFSTDATPTVTSTSPLINENGVPLSKVITAQFSMAMSPTSLNGTTFTLKIGTTPVLGTVSYNGTNLSFAPAANLLPETEYTATITTGAKSLVGMPLAANYEWTFSTKQVPAVLSTDPVNNATSVALNKIISAKFNIPMDPLSLIGTTFTVKQGTIPVLGTVTYNGTDLSFIPSGNLTAGTEYTATINTGAKSLAGISLAANYIWKFTTLTTPPIPPVTPLFSSIFGSFGGLAGVTNQGIYTVINNGSIGSTGASTLITGFHDNTGDKYTETPLNIGNVKGRVYTDGPPPVIFEAGGPYGGNAGTMAIAQAGLNAARNFYISISPANRPGGVTLSTEELGGRTLAPGTYTSGSSYKITNLDLTLDAQGDPNAVWVFQVSSDLTVGIPSGPRSVLLINGGQAKNVYWYVGASAVINYAGGGTMVGTIIANSGVTLSSPGNSTNTTVQTVLNGRAISLVSSVTMVNTVINVPN